MRQAGKNDRGWNFRLTVSFPSLPPTAREALARPVPFLVEIQGVPVKSQVTLSAQDFTLDFLLTITDDGRSIRIHDERQQPHLQNFGGDVAVSFRIDDMQHMLTYQFSPAQYFNLVHVRKFVFTAHRITRPLTLPGCR